MKRTPKARPESSEQPSVNETLCHRVRELRRKRQWTLEELAAASRVSRSMLSEIELGRANPTLAVAYRIAQALGLSLGELVETPDVSGRMEVIRADDLAFHFRSDQQCRVRTLSPLHLEKSVEFYEITLHAGGVLRSTPHFRGARELLSVQQGKISVQSGEEKSELAAGDSAYYPADVPHAIENCGTGDAVVYLVVTYTAD